jgi:hypothetical protein
MGEIMPRHWNVEGNYQDKTWLERVVSSIQRSATPAKFLCRKAGSTFPDLRELKREAE